MDWGWFFYKEIKIIKNNLSTYIKGRALLVSSFLILAILVYVILGSRINHIIMTGQTTSIFIRIVRPFIIVKQALLHNPLFGVGIGNAATLATYYLSNYNLFAFGQLGEGYMVMSLLAPLAFWGIVGTTAQAGLLIFYLRKKVNRVLLLFLIINYVLISISMAGFVTIVYWGYLFIIIRVYTINNSTS